MSVVIDALLALPLKKRRKIAEKLWDSLPEVNSILKEDEELIMLLDKRWKNIEEGKSKLYSTEQMKKMVAEYRNK